MSDESKKNGLWNNCSCSFMLIVSVMSKSFVLPYISITARRHFDCLAQSVLILEFCCSNMCVFCVFKIYSTKYTTLSIQEEWKTVVEDTSFHTPECTGWLQCLHWQKQEVHGLNYNYYHSHLLSPLHGSYTCGQRNIFSVFIIKIQEIKLFYRATKADSVLKPDWKVLGAGKLSRKSWSSFLIALSVIFHKKGKFETCK